MRVVHVLFTRPDTIYRDLAAVEVYGKDRDARTCHSGPIIAHPPCRAWSVMRHCARPEPGEWALAPWAVGMVRRYGGVLEHPRGSKLWEIMSLPLPGEKDAFGFTLEYDQYNYGHRASKPTWLYIAGTCLLVWANNVMVGTPTHCISQGHGIRKGHPRFKPRVTDKEREATPRPFAEELLRIARVCYARDYIGRR